MPIIDKMDNNANIYWIPNKDKKHVFRVAIADDHALFRSGVKNGLESKYKDIQFVAEAENGMQLLNLIKQIPTDIVLLDIQMPIMDGLATLPEIKKLYPNIKVIMLSMHNDHSIISKMMEIGASYYLTKESGSDLIYQTIKGVYENENLQKELINQFLDESFANNNYRTFLEQNIHLSEKEITILKLICDSKSINEIADTVDLDPKIAEEIVNKIKIKTRARSSYGLYLYAVRSGLLDEKTEELVSLISKEQLTDLFNLSNSILSYVNHDLSGKRAVIYNSLNQLKEEFQNNRNDEIADSEIITILEKAFEATRSVSSINELIKFFVNANRSNNQARLFIAWPIKIVEAIKERYKDAEIKVLSQDNYLRFVYPNVILFSILSEFVENAKKNTNGKLVINIKWKMKGNIFQCEIHDNGPGFQNLIENKLVPMSGLDLEHFGLGLKIIERTIFDSNGLLFFSKSDILNGAKIYFQFPVLNFTSDMV